MADPKTKPAGKGALYLVDGSGYIFRAYHALPPLTRKRDKLPTGAVLGFCNMLSKLLNDIGPSNHMAVLFDAGRNTFRNEIYPDYKAHRPPPPEDLVPQFALIREATRAFNLASIERDGFEADDLIASYARAARDEGYEVVIVSSDKDLMQLIEPGVSMHDPLKDRAIGEQEVREKFGVGPEKMVDLQALAGDATDNVPGVPGIGVKTAAELINTFGGLDEVLARAEEIKQPKRRQSLIEHADAARISRDLVRLRRDLPLAEGVNDLQIKPPDLSVLVPFLEDLEFGNLLARLRARYGEEGGPPAPAPAPKPAAAALPGGEEAVTIVQTPEDLKRLAAAARMAGAVALHLEGTVADEMRAAVVGIACAYAPGRAWYVPLGHVSAVDQGSLELGDAAPDGAPPQIPADEAIALLKPLLEDPGTLKIGHNIKGPVKVLARLGITVAPIEDSMLLSFTLGGGRDKHGAAEIAQRLLEVTAASRKEALGTGKSAVSFAQLPLETAAALAGEAADLVLRSHAPLRAGLLAEQLVAVYETIERPLVPVLAAMERHGLRVDERALAGLSKDFAGRMADLEVAIHRLAGGEFNVGSPKQLGEILFDQMGLPGGRRAKTGAWTTGADVLEALAADGNELPELVLDWRQLSKLKNTYTDTLGGQIDPETGRVHTTYQMAGAATGRLASFDPNLQNIPIRTEEGRKIRRAFTAGPAAKLVSADYSQIELRLLAHMARIGALRDAFSAGTDIHALTASQVFGVPVEGMDPSVRRRAKAINFGIIYGISAFGLGRQLNIPRKEAGAYIDAYFERYPGIRDYMEQTKIFAREHGYVTTLFGRRVHVPGIHDRNHAHRAFSERAAINAPLQGSAADIIKRAMVRMHRALDRSGLEARMLLSVHDELLFEVPKNEIADLSALAKEVMEGAAHLDVPLTVECGAGKNWDEAH